VRKTYEVKVKGRPDAAQLTALARGVRLAEGVSGPAAVRVLEASERKTWLSITLAEGKNRQVRRMCDGVGLDVEKLVRVALGPLKLGKLPAGAWRHLEPDEVAALHGVSAAVRRAPPSTEPRGASAAPRRERPSARRQSRAHPRTR
jgi:23S rRNA pseudouridine2605 synthase